MRIRSIAVQLLSAGVLLFLPALAIAQSCRWDGTAPFCGGSCGGNESELTRLGSIPDFWVPPFVNGPSFGASCVTGSKALCCVTPGRSCHWAGTAPFCAGECNGDEVRASPPPGSSSGAGCLTGSKVYCCAKVGSTSQALVARNCASGPGTCTQGFVWRESNPNDHVCVVPGVRQQAHDDNAQAGARRQPGGGAFGPDTCRPGFVWREAFANDHVCVPPSTREQARQDNHWASIRNACP